MTFFTQVTTLLTVIAGLLAAMLYLQLRASVIERGRLMAENDRLGKRVRGLLSHIEANQGGVPPNVDPAEALESYEHDAAGNLVYSSGRRFAPSGRELTRDEIKQLAAEGID